MTGMAISFVEKIKKGQIIRKIPEAEFIPTLRYELEHWNEQ